jgi:Clp amino terminal domain, pathogenicity island component
MTPTDITLERLIQRVEEARPEAAPLDLLAEAVSTAADLDQLADHLIGHYVDLSRTAGASWTQIGERLGVTKQAAQQRFVPAGPSKGIFDRFTDRARRVVAKAQSEAGARHHDFIGTEHVLLALCGSDGIAARALTAVAGSTDAVRDALLPLLSPDGTGPGVGHIPFTRRAKKAMDVATREALRLGHNYIGTEHLLLGLLGEGTERDHGLARQALTAAGVTYDAARAEIVRQIAAYGDSRADVENAE